MGCGTTRVSTRDVVIRNYADNARAAYESGRTEQAAELYGRAMDRARLIDAPEEAGRNAYNLALCQIAMRQSAEARKWLRQAKLLLGREPGAAMAKIMVAEAEAARLGGQFVEAIALASAALIQGAESPEIVQAELLLAEMSMDQGEADMGKKHYRKAVYRVSKGTAPSVRARLDAVAARLIQAAVMKGDAAVCLERRANWLKASGDYCRMGESLKEAGDAYAATGRPSEAFDLLVRAAVSLKAAGKNVQALNTAEQAVALAEQFGDPMCVERAAILVEGMKR
jgi:tetratricopeptide (TPR) repeat protein